MAKRIICMLLVLVTLGSLCAGFVSAASISAYDSLSSSRYAKVYTLKSSGRITPYTGPDLRYPGTTNGRSSGAYIDCRTDELWLYDVGETNGKLWAKVSYPVGRNARRTAYIPLSELTANTHSIQTVSSGKFLCSPRQNGALNSSYYVAKSDTVWLLAVYGSQVQILYPTGGNRYRIAFANKSDYEKYCGTIDGLVDVTAQFAGKTITMKSVENGKYLCADGNINGTPLMANRDSASTWETFTVSPLTEDGWVGIKAHNGKYLSAMADTRDTPIGAKYDGLYTWERFRIYQRGEDYYFKSYVNGKWLCVRVDTNQAPVQAYANGASTWERIRIEVTGEPFWTWPMAKENNGYRVTQTFNNYYGPMASKYGRPYHTGIDMVCTDRKIMAAADGKVIYRSYTNGNGNHIVLEHNFNGATVYTLYSHLSNFNGCPAVGQTVSKGTVIGTMGSTGNSTGAHLHFAIYSGYSTDPTGYSNTSNASKIYYKARNLTFYNPEYVIANDQLP